MNDLSKFGLAVRTIKGCPPGQTRLEVRTADTKKHVGLFHLTVRESAEETVVNLSTQLVRRKELTDEQLTAIQKWQEALVIPGLAAT